MYFSYLQCNKKKISNTNIIPQDVQKDHRSVDVTIFYKSMCRHGVTLHMVLWALLSGCVVS